MTLGSIHGSGTILGSITLAIMAVSQALAAVAKPQTRPEVDEAEHRNRREDARTQNIWLFGA
jgi:hypothetical protein